MKTAISALFTLALSPPLLAHPHIFVDTGLDLRFNDAGQLSEVRITWAYDEFYSLLIMEDRALDPDFDGVLTPAEQEDLTGFDMQWTEGFNGDLVIEQSGKLLILSGPMDATAAYADGRITTTHVRKVSGALANATSIEIKPYDPTYYTAYDITLPVNIEGADVCRDQINVPNIDEQLTELRDQLNLLDANVLSSDENAPDVGILLASTVVVTCEVS
ncbi:MAG: DUF1007 family protein [Sulfitobacter sp.]